MAEETETPLGAEKDEKAEEDKETGKESGKEGKAENTTASPLEEAKDVLAKITEQNKLMAANIERAEKASAVLLLGGQASAGQETKEKTQEEKDDEGAKNLLKGTGYDEQLFPEK